MSVIKLWPDDFEPGCLDEFVLHPDSRQSLINIVRGLTGVPSHGQNGILLHGPNGTGKTTMALLLPHLIEYAKLRPAGSITEADAVTTTGEELSDAGYHKKKLNCRTLNYDQLVKEINAQHTGFFRPDSGFVYQILDEVDELGSRQTALKGLMNDLDKTIFILTTNHLNYIDRGVRSRCIEIDFSPAPMSEWKAEIRRAFEKTGNPTIMLDDPRVIAWIEQEVKDNKGDARKLHTKAQQLFHHLYPQ